MCIKFKIVVVVCLYSLKIQYREIYIKITNNLGFESVDYDKILFEVEEIRCAFEELDTYVYVPKLSSHRALFNYDNQVSWEWEALKKQMLLYFGYRENLIDS